MRRVSRAAPGLPACVLRRRHVQAARAPVAAEGCAQGGALVTCVVCGRSKSQHLKVSDVDIDGVKCRVCEECEGDQFRRPYAVKWTREGKPVSA